jgi:hypothetical protein
LALKNPIPQKEIFSILKKIIAKKTHVAAQPTPTRL